MGAVNFSIDDILVRHLVQHTGATIFFETGTYRGDSIQKVRPFFQKLITVELIPELYSYSEKRFQGDSRIECHLGSSGEVLQQVLPTICDQGLIFWLDAHWCDDEAVQGDTAQCSLLNELSAIKSLNSKSVILIDDARYFLAPPPAPHKTNDWPSLDQVINKLYSLSSDHALVVFNDMLVFMPKPVEIRMKTFLQKNSFNLLTVLDKSRDYDKILAQAQEKEEVIRDLKQENDKRHQIIEKFIKQKDIEQRDNKSLYLDIQNKQKAMEDLAVQIEAWRMVGFLLLPLQKTALSLIKLKKKVTQVRLGVLHQYRPRRPRKSWLAEDVKITKTLPTISLVTPSFNQARFIEETIRSVVDQRYPGLEYFIQDGGSTDGTVNILKKLSGRLSGWRSSTDQGQAHAINLAFSQTSGDIMGWLNSDDLHFPHTLWRIGNYFQTHPEVDVVYGNRLIINEAGQEIGKWILPKHKDAILTWADYVPQETLFWRRRIWDKAGGRLDPVLQFALDWDLLVRFREAGASIRHLDEFLGCFRVHDDQKTSLQLSSRGTQEMNLIRYRIHGRIPDQKEIWVQLKKYLRKSVYSHNAWLLKRHCFHILTLGLAMYSRKRQHLKPDASNTNNSHPQAGAGAAK